MLTCPSCGNEEPEGSRFCGNCGTPFPAAVEQPDHPAPTEADTADPRRCSECGSPVDLDAVFCGECGAALPPEPSSSQPAAEEPPVEPGPTPRPRGPRRLRWIAAGVVAALLLAAGATAALLSLTGGDSTEAASTEEQTLPSETQPLETSPTLADEAAPHLEEVAAAQAAVNVGVRALSTGSGSFAALRQAGASLAASVTRAQGFLDTLAPSDSSEASTLSLLRLALSSHLAYANPIAFFPTGPPPFVEAQAREAITRAETVRRAYADLVSADPALPIVSISGSDHNVLLAAVPAPEPTPTVAQRVIDLAPLLVGIRPDDPPGEGRCFGRYSSRATLRVSGVVYRSGFIQCGDAADGDPSRASGVYRFSGPTLPPGSRLARVAAQAVIDESSSPSQRGSSVTWTVFYDGTPICSETVVWSGSGPQPGKLDCRIPSATSPGGYDGRRLRIEQVASLASTGDFWAGLLNPTIVVEVPR
jgi:hypothetical protein